jgi:hypothetical protein
MSIASDLSDAMCIALIQHLDGQGVLWTMPTSSRDPIERERLSHQRSTRNALVARGLIRYDRREVRAHLTYLTKTGRDELALVLGKWADIASAAYLAAIDARDDDLIAVLRRSPIRTEAEQMLEGNLFA